MYQIRQAALKDYVLAGIYLLCIFIIGYFLERYQTIPLLFSFSLLFLVYLLVILNNHIQPLFFYLTISMLARFILILSIPGLSDDFYRFIWDGRLLNEGINPFSLLPVEVLDNPASVPGINESLLNQLNSPEYYTVYPPVNQLIFWVSVKIFPQSIVGSVAVMRIFILFAESGSLFLIYQLLKIHQLPLKNILVYALNPLVIIELTGNLHFEALVIFFILLCLFLLHKKKIMIAGISFAFAIASKLVPVIFLPLFISRLKKKVILFFLVTGSITFLLFLPLLGSALFEGMSSSISLYFKKFEFNASIYYLVREAGYWIKGYNIIQTAGPYLALAVLILIAAYTYWEWNKQFHLFFSFTWILFIYFIFATIIHPWYITPLIVFVLFTRIRFPIVWSYVIFFTYTFYQQNNFNENLLIVSVEYLVVIMALLTDLRNWFKQDNQKNENLKTGIKIY